MLSIWCLQIYFRHLDRIDVQFRFNEDNTSMFTCAICQYSVHDRNCDESTIHFNRRRGEMVLFQKSQPG